MNSGTSRDVSQRYILRKQWISNILTTEFFRYLIERIKRKNLHVIECWPCVQQPSEHVILIIAFPLPTQAGLHQSLLSACCEDGLPSNEFCARLEGHLSSLPVHSALCVWTRCSPDLLGVISTSASPSCPWPLSHLLAITQRHGR